PPCPGIGIGMGGAGIGIGCGGSGIPPPPYEGCMRGIVFTEKYIVAPGPPVVRGRGSTSARSPRAEKPFSGASRCLARKAMRVLVVGGGGREHAIAKALLRASKP